MSVIELSVNNFEKEVLESKETVLVDFWADWCGPCKMLSPIVDQVAQEVEGVKVAKVNIDQAGELAMKYKVMSIPTLIVFKDGVEVKRSLGAIPKSAIMELLG